MRVSPQSELAKKVTQIGFAFLPSHLPTQSSGEAILQLGSIEKLDGLSEIQELTPKEASESAPNLYSGNFGCSDFPFHTDLAHWFQPPRYLVLRCVESGSEPGWADLDLELRCTREGCVEMSVAARVELGSGISYEELREGTALRLSVVVLRASIAIRETLI